MKSLYANMEKWSPHVLSILRIVVGLLFLEHGLSKLLGFPVPGPSSLGGLSFLAATLEAIGGLLLVGGVYTRIVAFILSGEMAIAYFMAHAPRSFYPIANAGEGAILYCFIFLYLAFAGGRAVERRSCGAEAGLAFSNARARARGERSLRVRLLPLRRCCEISL